MQQGSRMAHHADFVHPSRVSSPLPFPPCRSSAVCVCCQKGLWCSCSSFLLLAHVAHIIHVTWGTRGCCVWLAVRLCAGRTSVCLSVCVSVFCVSMCSMCGARDHCMCPSVAVCCGCRCRHGVRVCVCVCVYICCLCGV